MTSPFRLHMVETCWDQMWWLPFACYGVLVIISCAVVSRWSSDRPPQTQDHYVELTSNPGGSTRTQRAAPTTRGKLPACTVENCCCAAVLFGLAVTIAVTFVCMVLLCHPSGISFGPLPTVPPGSPPTIQHMNATVSLNDLTVFGHRNCTVSGFARLVPRSGPWVGYNISVHSSAPNTTNSSRMVANTTWLPLWEPTPMLLFPATTKVVFASNGSVVHHVAGVPGNATHGSQPLTPLSLQLSVDGPGLELVVETCGFWGWYCQSSSQPLPYTEPQHGQGLQS